MKHCVLAISLFIAIINTSAITSAQSPKSPEIDAYVSEISDRYEIPGVALAILKDGEVVHQKNYGFASLEHQVPISNTSIFRVYSLTKLLVTIGVFQLIEQDKLSLEDRISTYVPSLPSTWQAIQIQHLLSHSSGLPDKPPFPESMDLTEEEFKSGVFGQRIKFNPGSEYDYNQTNFWLLQEIIETISEQPLEEFIISNQFDSPSDAVFFSSDSREIIRHRVTAYFPFTKGHITIDHPYVEGDYAFAMNGLNISLDEFIQWSKNLHSNQLIKAETRQKMWQTYAYSSSTKSFTYGWDKRITHSKESFGFSGSLVTAYRIFPGDNVSIIFLANGLGTYFDIEDVINHIAGIVFSPQPSH